MERSTEPRARLPAAPNPFRRKRTCERRKAPMLRHAPLALAFLLLAPIAAASHWTSPADADTMGDSQCIFYNAPCVAEYLCTGGAPLPGPDFVTYCAFRAEGEAGDVALWAPRMLWDWGLDYPTYQAEQVPRIVNAQLCNALPDLACEPYLLPDDAPAEDPVDEFPLW